MNPDTSINTETPPRRPSHTRGPARSDDGFDYLAWTKDVCDASGVPLGIEDLLTLKKLSVLTHPGSR